MSLTLFNNKKTYFKIFTSNEKCELYKFFKEKVEKKIKTNITTMTQGSTCFIIIMYNFVVVFMYPIIISS